MVTRRRGHIDRRPVTLVLAATQDDWLHWCHTNGYNVHRTRGHTASRPDGAATRPDSRAIRVLDDIDATHVGHELVETEAFADRDDADRYRQQMARMARP